jgi:uncharacterized membrane protein YdcZ (DUF606 family)
MDYVIAIWAIVWILFNMPSGNPPAPMWKIVVGCVGVILIVFALFGLQRLQLR